MRVTWFAKKISWWKNPGRTDSMWQEADIHTGFNIEFAVLADMDNDGKANEVVAQENGTPQAWYEVKNGAWVSHEVSDKSYGHGIGAGDVNGDKRTDILTPRGWLEAPADPRAAATGRSTPTGRRSTSRFPSPGSHPPPKVPSPSCSNSGSCTCSMSTATAATTSLPVPGTTTACSGSSRARTANGRAARSMRHGPRRTPQRSWT